MPSTQNAAAQAGEAELFAPVPGEIIPIERVGDPVFAAKMMGEGFGVKSPTSGEVASPVSGEVTVTTSSSHAFGVRTDEGLEVLVHLGIDTVELRGEPFDMSLAKHQRVEAGQTIGTMDLEAVRKAGKDATVIVAITNSADRVGHIRVHRGEAERGASAAAIELRG